jgi:hypothetical protein
MYTFCICMCICIYEHVHVYLSIFIQICYIQIHVQMHIYIYISKYYYINACIHNSCIGFSGHDSGNRATTGEVGFKVLDQPRGQGAAISGHGKIGRCPAHVVASRLRQARMCPCLPRVRLSRICPRVSRKCPQAVSPARIPLRLSRICPGLQRELPHLSRAGVAIALVEHVSAGLREMSEARIHRPVELV